MQQLSALPPSKWYFVLALIPIIWPLKGRYRIIYVCFYLGAVYSSYLAYERLNIRLPTFFENKTIVTKILVTSIASETESTIQFDAKILHDGYSQIPSKVRVIWNITRGFNLYKYGPKVEPLPDVVPGQVWAVNLRIKSPSGLMNPGGFDSEANMFRKGYRLIGAIKGHPRLESEHNFDFPIRVEYIRHKVRERLKAYLENKKYGGIILALVMGDQSSIPQEYWELFNKTGITHLVSISGSHITMLSTMATLLVLILSRRLFRKGKLMLDSFNAHTLSLFIGLIVAFAYCQLAGWGVPAQRTFLMQLMIFLMKLLKLKASFLQNYLLVAIFILILDPWAILSVGFYLSFAAVAILQYILHFYKTLEVSDVSRWKKIRIMFLEWAKLQFGISFAISPFLILFFNQISIVSPLVNAYAIFLIGSIITPACLMLAMLVFINPYVFINQYFADTIHFLLFKAMQLTEYIARMSWASIDIPHTSTLFFALSLIGVAIVIVFKHRFIKLLGFLIIVPSMYDTRALPQYGNWELIAFDVGQGGGVLIKTKNKRLLFDTGVRTSPKNDGFSSVLASSFRYLGVDKLDYLVVSHADIDHTGGMAELIKNIYVDKVYASFKVDEFIDFEEEASGKHYRSKNLLLLYDTCKAGTSFSADGVKFTFLHPKNKRVWPVKSKNDESCVLLIEGMRHKVLLTGDILSEQEAGLLPQVKDIDLVLAAHHGSKSSSQQIFVNSTKPKIVIAQAGYMNRYGHPHEAVRQRWTQAGSEFLVTSELGAIYVRSDMYGLKWESYRKEKRKYWHRL